MFVVTNMRAAGGRARRRWDRVQSALTAAGATIRRCDMEDSLLTADLDRALRAGERDVAAAGGDGTVNALVNALMCQPDPEVRGHVRLGAIGLGSSNDFHKPVDGRRNIGDVPLALAFDRALPRDVGRVRLRIGGREFRRHFIVNASVGITATANSIFSGGGIILRTTRRWSTPTAISLAALSALLHPRPVRCTLDGPAAPAGSIDLTTLNILKSPHVSGAFRFPFTPGYDNGLFRVVLTTGSSRLHALRLAAALRSGDRLPAGFCTCWEAASVRVSSDTPFAVETDGEVTTACDALFEVVPRALRVCP